MAEVVGGEGGIDRAVDGVHPVVRQAGFILLGGAHGAVGGHAQFAHGLLLQGGGGERRGRAA